MIDFAFATLDVAAHAREARVSCHCTGALRADRPDCIPVTSFALASSLWARLTPLSSSPFPEHGWGAKLAELGWQHFTGELRVQVESSWYWISLANGAVMNAASPAPQDTATRIATSMHVITDKQAHKVALAAAADLRRDELELIATIAKMSDLDRDTFEAEVIVRRAARTFAIATGKLTTATVTTLPKTRFAIPVQAVIFVGARLHMAADALARDLRELGTFFKLAPDADVSGYSFTDAEQAVIESLRDGATIDELGAKHAAVERRTLEALAYALACTSAAVATTPRIYPRAGTLGGGTRRSSPMPVAVPKEPTPDEMRAARRLATAPLVVPKNKDED